jgi:hypothetical protein
MRRSVEVAFERLAQGVSEAAASIDCTPLEYRQGLELILETLEADRHASAESEPGDVEPFEDP